MKKAKLYLTVFFCIITSFLFAGESVTSLIETSNGAKFQCHFEYGLFKLISKGEKVKSWKDSSGEAIYTFKGTKREFIETNSIHYVVGDAFGFKFKIPELGNGDTLTITIDAIVPTISGGEKKISGNFMYDSKDNSERFKKIFWSMDDDERHPDVSKYGKFKLSLFNKGNLIISKTFIVTR